jgi:CHAT domain-containing protein
MAKKKCFVCADSLGNLPGALAEGVEVIAILRGLNYSVKTARRSVTKNKFLDKLSPKTDIVVHLASHGYYDNNYNPTFLFKNGDVTVDDIKNLGKSLTFKLFYASCCWSFIADGMAKKFQALGVKNYVGFPEPIPDDVAKDFTVDFFKRWLEDGMDLVTALNLTAEEYPLMPPYNLL